MKLLQKLSGIIAEKMPATPEIIIQSKGRFNYSSSDGTMPSKDAAYYRAFHALKSGEVQTEEELRTLIFPNGTSDANYRSFKSRLKKRLVNSLMLISIDAAEVSNTDAAEAEAMYYVYTAYISGILGGSDFTKELHDKAISIARKYEFFHIELRLLEEQWSRSMAYSTIQRLNKDLASISLVHEKLQLHVEVLKIKHEFVKITRSRMIVEKTQMKAHKVGIDALKKILEVHEINSAVNTYYSYLFSVCLLQHDYRALLIYCQELGDYLQRKSHFDSPNRQMYLATYRMLAHFRLGEYERSKEVFEAAIQKLPSSRIRIHIQRRMLSFQHAVYALDTEYAFDLYSFLSQKRNVQLMHITNKSDFIFLKAYLWLSYFLGLAQDSNYSSGIERKDVQAFISKRPNISTIRNDIPEYEQDKSGGLSLLRMLESTLLILTAREEIISKKRSSEEPLSNEQDFHHTIDRNIRYIKKHVPKDQKRVFAFAEIIHIISKNLYVNGIVLRKKIEKHRKKLSSTFVCDDIELLPFDKLADHLLIWWDKIGVQTAPANSKRSKIKS
jgi:tetratricopeptide (TPR) repeat protein